MRADDEEQLRYDKSMMEYNATLTSAEGGSRVKQVLDHEDGDTKKKMDDQFEDTLETVFGRAPDFDHAKQVSPEENERHLSEKDLDAIKIIRRGPR